MFGTVCVCALVHACFNVSVEAHYSSAVQVTTPTKVYLEYGYSKAKPFHRETWYVQILFTHAAHAFFFLHTLAADREAF
jgi:hypothetical protein